MTKIIVCTAGLMFPGVVDDYTKKHDSALMIQDENKKHNVIIGLNRDDKLSKPYEPYYTRVMSFDNLVYLRDELTKLINAYIDKHYQN